MSGTIEPIIKDPVSVSPSVVITAPNNAERVLVVRPPVAVARSIGRATLWMGEGPPTLVIGAVVGDEYLDTVTGTLYKQEVGA